MFDGVRLTWACSGLLRFQLAVRSWPRGSSSMTCCVYCASALSENQARPFSIGPDRPKRGVQPWSTSPLWLVLQDWTPRFGLSRPIEKSPPWVSDTSQKHNSHLHSPHPLSSPPP